MRLIRQRAYARAGLMGNPSDGYHGKTISLSVRDFWAEVVLYEWEDVELVWSQDEHSRFNSIHELARDVRLHGYYGGIRLVKATIKKFHDYCVQQSIALHAQNFSVRYETNIPRQVGLAGSSAIIVATLRALIEFYGVAIPREIQPSLARSVETEELGIAGGLQDRVVQVYQGLVYMDFSRERMQSRHGLEYGVYEPLDPALLPPIYVAYNDDASEPTEIVHNDLRARYQAGDPAVHAAMDEFAGYAAAAREALVQGDAERLHALINANFDLRRRIMPLPASQVQMVDTARATGASAKFAGSGGAIIGTFRDEATYERLRSALGAIGCAVFRPRVV